jgi:hypothetical protein
MKPSVRYGIIAALLIVAMHLAIYYSGKLFTPAGAFSRLFGLFIMLPFIVMSINSRKRQLGGEIGFRESIRAGMTTSLIVAIMLAIFNYIFFRMELSGAFMEEAQRQIIELKMDKTKAYSMLKGVYWTYSPASQSTYTLMWTLIAGFIMSLASATFIVKKKSENP